MLLVLGSCGSNNNSSQPANEEEKQDSEIRGVDI